MARRSLALIGLCAAVNAGAADVSSEPREPFLGEAFFYARQGEYFDAISRLDTELQQFRRVDEPELDPLHFHVNSAEFSVGDFELSYRMHQKAGRAIRAVLEGNVADEIRNEAAYRLARIEFERGDVAGALQALGRVKGKVPEAVRNDERLLRAQVYMAAERLPEAIEILSHLKGEQGYEGFAGYNLGVAMVRKGDEREGLSQLEKAGQIEARDDADRSIRDKANLALGYRLLDAKEPAAAQQFLDRVRIEGLFSDRALLGSGWAAINQGHFDQALVPWSLLVKRNPTGKAVQEALLSVPYAYSRLELHGRAALLYGQALEAFGKELERIKTSSDRIRYGHLLKALEREELKQDPNWVIRLRSLPDAPETFYLKDLMASNDFQSSLQNYVDLAALRQRLDTWDSNLDAFEEMISLRRAYYEPLLPGIDKRFRVLDSQLRLRMEQRQSLDDRLRRLLVMPNPETLITADERQQRARLDALEKQWAGASGPEADAVRRRIARLRGVLRFNIVTNYDQRLSDAWLHLRELDVDVERQRKIYAGYVRTRQAATQSYQGYDKRISQSRQRLREARDTVDALKTRQGRFMETMALAELDRRRGRLEEYQVKARFAMAESYDRAVKAQMQGKESQSQAKADQLQVSEGQAK